MTFPPSQSVSPGSSARIRQRSPRPWVTISICVVTGLVYLVQLFTEYTLNVDVPLNLGAKVNELIVQGEVWRLVTPIFLHVSIPHILFNLYAIYIFGPNLEFSYGRMRFLLLYMVGGIAGNVASFYFSPYVSAGASTAIFGMVAAQGVLVFRNRKFFGRQARPILNNILLIVVINLVFGATVGGIDNWGHIGGLVGGLAFAWFAGPLYKEETVVLNYGGSASQSYPTLETPLPQYAVRLVDQVSGLQPWIVGGFELFILAALVLARILNY